MKFEGKNILNILTINSKYICYTLKGNLIRIIQTTTGDKLLLKGHENNICDMKYSIINSNILCSIDNGLNGLNIFIWKLFKDTIFNSQIMCNLPLSATLIQSHPTSSSVWAVSHESSICLISTLQQSLQYEKRLSYDDFSCNWKFNGIITG